MNLQLTTFRRFRGQSSAYHWPHHSGSTEYGRQTHAGDAYQRATTLLKKTYARDGKQQILVLVSLYIASEQQERKPPAL